MAERLDLDEQATEVLQQFSGPAILGLRARRREQRAIGCVEAEPCLRLGSNILPALSISQQLATNPDFIRLPQGQVPRSVIQAAGITSYGRASDGTTLQPLPLGPEAVLWQDFSKLQGPWQFTIPLDINLPKGGRALLERAYNQLEWLRTWGLPGGLVGTLHQYGTPLLQWLDSYLRLVAQPWVLIVGTTTVLNYVKRLTQMLFASKPHFVGLDNEARPGELNLITPETLVAKSESTSALTGVRWDIVCLINVDLLLESGPQALIPQVQALPKALFIGLFHNNKWCKREVMRNQVASLLGIQPAAASHLIWQYLIRDPQLTPRAISPAAAAQLDTQAEAVSFSGWGRSTPRASIFTLTPYTYEHRAFIRDAAKYVSAEAPPAPPQAYYHRRPTFSTLDKRQLAWYLYWRSQVRQGQYPDTYLDYITLYATELINGFGIPSVMAGYRQLEALWLNYRQRFEPLDNWLPEWLCDYLLANGCPLDPLTPLQQALELGLPSRYLNILLDKYQERGWEATPFTLLEQLLGLALSDSTVYQPEDLAEIAATVLRVLATLDDIWQRQDGCKLLARWRPHQAQIMKRKPFINALFARPTRLICFARYYPYSEQPGFIRLLLGIVKHTENLLRAQRGYRGRVRGLELPLELQSLIEKIFNSSRPRIQVRIDLAEVARLKRASDEVRDLLLAEAGNTEAGEIEQRDQAPVAELVPQQQPLLAGQLLATSTSPTATDSGEPWRQLVAQLGPPELAALQILLNSGSWNELVRYCQAQDLLPELLVDNVNAVALDIIGDLLIDTTSDEPCLVAEYMPELEAMLAKLATER